ncbi:MAG: hypothetical protein ACREBU_18660 [Nitrososphaera sp.]
MKRQESPQRAGFLQLGRSEMRYRKETLDLIDARLDELRVLGPFISMFEGTGYALGIIHKMYRQARHQTGCP